MKRAAIYARFSSDLQDSRSIGDQVTLCCDYAQRQGYLVARVYDDAAASGASLHGRPGIKRLIDDAQAKAFDVLIAESMSRIGRDQEDRAYVRKRHRFFRIGIETPSEGVVTPLIDGVRAALDSEYLEDLKRHTRRGMTGRVREGLSAGGLTYGYAPGICRRPFSARDRRTTQCGRHQTAAWRRLAGFRDQRQLGARLRHLDEFPL